MAQIVNSIFIWIKDFKQHKCRCSKKTTKLFSAAYFLLVYEAIGRNRRDKELMNKVNTGLMLKTFLLIALSISLQLICCGQQDIDSLKKAAQLNTANDSSKIETLLQLSRAYQETDPYSAIQYANQALGFAETINYKKGIANALKNIGMGHYFLAQYIETLENWERSLAYFDSIGDRANTAKILSNMGAVYVTNGEEAKALEYHLKSLKIAEEIKDTARIVSAMNNIGVVYMIKKATYDKALQYFLKLLPLAEQVDDKASIGSACVNLGELYFSMGDNKKALLYYEKSLVAYKNTEDVTYTLNNMGKLYAATGDYEKAKKYHTEAYEISQKISARQDMAISKLGLADVYAKQKDYKNALESYKEVETISKEIRSVNELKDAYRGLAITYSSLNDFKNAFKYQTLLTDIKDTLYNIETDKKLLGIQFDFDLQKKQGEINLLTKDKALQELDIKRQKLAKNAFITGFVLVLIITFIIYKNYRAKIKTNLILDAQKAQIESLLLNILPEEVANELQDTGHASPRYYESVSVLFTDFKGFTKLAADLSPQEVVSELDSCFVAFDDIIEKYGLEKIKTIGDSYMCAGGIPTTNNIHPVNMVKASIEIRDFMNNWNEKRKAEGLPTWELRIGINTGPIVAGVVGKKKYAYDIWGKTVNIASRMESNGEPGQVNISDTTYELVKDQFSCTYRGKISAKNAGEIDMYFVDGFKKN